MLPLKGHKSNQIMSFQGVMQENGMLLVDEPRNRSRNFPISTNRSVCGSWQATL